MSGLTRFRDFRALSGVERSATLVASALNPAMLVMLKARGARWTIGFVERHSLKRFRTHRRASNPDSIRLATRIGSSVNRAAAGPAPATTCLARSLTTQLLLRRRGIDARLRIGVARQRSAAQDQPLSFHAWVEVAGTPVNDAHDVGLNYSTLHLAPALDALDIRAQA